jgi:FkbM family methyltransferase
VSVAKGISTVARLAPLVHESAAFALRLATRDSSTARYRLRGSDVVIHLRHATPDVNTLEEIFRLGHYAIPGPVAAALDAVPGTLEVVDLGANIGLFGAYVLRRYPSARITAFEPDPANLALLRRSAQANGGAWRWEIVPACAAVADGEVPFAAGRFTTSRLTDAGAQRAPAVDVFAHLDRVDLVKIDIEGAEWPILADPRFSRVPARAVALEYHPHLCPAPDPRAAALHALRSAGYRTAELDFALPPGHGVVWGWRPD